MARERPVILIDIDGVVADLVGALCEKLTDEGFARTPAEFREYEFDRCVSREELDIIRYWMSAPDFCQYIPQYPGAKEFVDALKEIGEVIAVTKPYPFGPTWAWERGYWCEKRMGIDKVIQTAHKEYVRGDCLIEDHPGNLSRWLHANPGTFGVLLSRPWNSLDLDWHTGQSFAANATSFHDVLGTVRELWEATADVGALAVRR